MQTIWDCEEERDATLYVTMKWLGFSVE